MYAIGGTMYATGMPEREPVKLGLTVQQFFAGMVSATATMGAYMGSVLQGIGQHVDLSLFEIMTGSQDRAVQGHTTYQFTGVVPQRAGGGTGRNILPNGAYPCADGYVQMFAMRPVWREACLMVDRPDLIEDPYFTAPQNFTGNPEARAQFEVDPAGVAAAADQEGSRREGAIGGLHLRLPEHDGGGLRGPASGRTGLLRRGRPSVRWTFEIRGGAVQNGRTRPGAQAARRYWASTRAKSCRSDLGWRPTISRILRTQGAI